MMRSANLNMMPIDALKTPNRERASESQSLPARWLDAQRSLAANTNLALVTIGPDNVLPVASNETSICKSFLVDPQKTKKCAEFCGAARDRALQAGEKITYTCHAGLRCFAIPVQTGSESQALVLIGGRAFTSTRDYRAFIEREQGPGSTADLRLCQNIKFASEEELNRAARLVASQAQDIFRSEGRTEYSKAFGAEPGRFERTSLHLAPAVNIQGAVIEKNTEQDDSSILTIPLRPVPQPVENREIEAFFALPFEKACCEALRLIGLRYGFKSLALFIRRGEKLVSFVASGPQRNRLIHAVVEKGETLYSRLQAQNLKPRPLLLSEQEIAFLVSDEELAVAEIAMAFPLFIAGAIQGALLVLDEQPAPEARISVMEFMQQISVPLELARLRSELNERAQAGADLRDFASRLATLSDPAEIYAEVLRKSMEALGARRASVLTWDDQLQALIFRESYGLSEEILRTGRLRAGEGIAGRVFERGEPLLVRDVRQLDVSSETQWIVQRVRDHHGLESEERSFISFPIRVGENRIGVLNLAGKNFGPEDLKWLSQVIPHAALALDRIQLREQAERYQLMSITDPLTGLVNRRYLEERFSEELRRSQRYYYPLSVLMIDIDNFKSYNDSFGHQAGDEVLRAVAHCIRGALRNFDVAARYGGEEFCVVLPETEEAAAAGLAERLRAHVEREFGPDNPQIHRAITISVGVASLGPGLQTSAKIIRAADQALYAAKGRGRNCVMVGRRSAD